MIIMLEVDWEHGPTHHVHQRLAGVNQQLVTLKPLSDQISLSTTQNPLSDVPKRWRHEWGTTIEDDSSAGLRPPFFIFGGAVINEFHRAEPSNLPTRSVNLSFREKVHWKQNLSPEFMPVACVEYMALIKCVSVKPVV